MLTEKVEETDFSAVKKDLEPFIINKSALESISKELFIGSIDMLECV